MIIRRFVIKFIFFSLVFLPILFLNQACARNTISGKVVSVTDGDTITVLDSSNTQHKIRIYGVDCPESHQDYGQKAKQFTSDLVFGKTVEIKIMDTDRYGRTVGIVNIDSKSLNAELIINGMAWFYGQYCKESFCPQWNQYQEEAKNRKIGLWSMQNPIPPWEFRHGSSKMDPNPTTTTQNAGAYHGNSKSMVFHSSKCKFYDCKNCTAVFPDRDMAIKTGFRPCGECKP
ncbi:MAG: thermonuclease family protein [Deltaproteobacteria bacterium]|jgi:micrococcal nuclease